MGKLKYPWITHDPWISTRGCGYFSTHIHGRYGLEFEGSKSMGMGMGQPMDYPCSALELLVFNDDKGAVMTRHPYRKLDAEAGVRVSDALREVFDR